MTRKQHEECVKQVIDHWRNRYLALEKQMQDASVLRRRKRTKKFAPASRDRLLKKQDEYFRNADQYQRYLAGFISCRRMCELVGFADDKNTLAPIFQQLQMAHDELLDRGFKDRLELILGGLQAGIIDREAAHSLLGMSAKKVQNYYLATSPGENGHGSTDYRMRLLQELSDPQFAVEYFVAAARAGDSEVLRLVVRNILEADGGIYPLVEVTKVQVSANAVEPAGIWGDYEVGEQNDKSLPVTYTLTGILVGPPRVGANVTILRLAQNGIAKAGVYQSRRWRASAISRNIGPSPIELIRNDGWRVVADLADIPQN